MGTSKGRQHGMALVDKKKNRTTNIMNVTNLYIFSIENFYDWMAEPNRYLNFRPHALRCVAFSEGAISNLLLRENLLEKLVF